MGLPLTCNRCINMETREFIREANNQEMPRMRIFKSGGETMNLSCGHKGVEIWRSEDGKTIGLQGTVNRCSVCMGYNKNGWASPTVYLIQVEEEKGSQ